MRASERVKEFIRQQEGLRLAAYRCPAGVWTIGYGHTGVDVKPGMVINPARANELLEGDLGKFEQGLGALIAAHAPLAERLTQGRYDALLSFAYNVGLDAFRGSTLWRKVKADVNDPTIGDEFGRWVYAKGVRLPGLVKRRAGEARMWQQGCQG